MEIVVRLAEPEDLTEIRLLDPHSLYISKELIAQKIDAEEIVVACLKDQAVGFLKLSFIWSTRPLLESVFVHPQYRRLKISRELVEFVLDHLASQEYAYVFSSAPAGDMAAQLWHQSLGFKSIGRLNGINLPYNDEPEIFYAKKLTDQAEPSEYPLL